FFFKAEDGIRDDLVTGVQTCALPISHRSPQTNSPRSSMSRPRNIRPADGPKSSLLRSSRHAKGQPRSKPRRRCFRPLSKLFFGEIGKRRVGKEWSSRVLTYD